MKNLAVSSKTLNFANGIPNHSNNIVKLLKIKVMKKNVFYLAVYLIVISFFVSCNNQEDISHQSKNEIQKEKQEMKQLIIALEKYNINYQESHGVLVGGSRKYCVLRMRML